MPTDLLGSAYAGQWIERRLEPDHLFDAMVARVLASADFRSGESWRVLAQFSKILAMMYTGWNLEGDDGPLPDPWLDPGAFLILYDVDHGVLEWLMDLGAEFAKRVTLQRQLDGALWRAMQKGVIGHG